jgi:hypothetical protein
LLPRKIKQRNCVYAIGAGFSAGLGYPLTSDLLFRLWPRLEKKFREDLSRVIRFHHPGFNEELFGTYPNVEELLSEMLVNEKLFTASRPYEGNFTLKELQSLQRDLLLRIGDWFHDLAKEVSWTSGWLHQFRERVYEENAALISFNWDLVLDRLLFGDGLGIGSYWLGGGDSPVLLKPHGSLNWFEHEQGQHIADDKRFEVFTSKGEDKVYAFRHYRAPSSKKERIYTPLIVPPVHLKEFGKPIFNSLWRETVSVLSRAKKVVFLGYSMPANDLHVQFIMRCGFYNQTEGMPTRGRKRTAGTGAADVVIVNPDQSAARRIAAVVGSTPQCRWISLPVGDWVTKPLSI